MRVGQENHLKEQERKRRPQLQRVAPSREPLDDVVEPTPGIDDEVRHRVDVEKVVDVGHRGDAIVAVELPGLVHPEIDCGHVLGAVLVELGRRLVRELPAEKDSSDRPNSPHPRQRA